jgi:adenylate kinase family enzyme
MSESSRVIIALIGPHGAGKSTLGKIYESNGYTHINVGFLARMARRKLFPAGVPLRLLFELRKHQPGTILGDAIVIELMQWIARLDKVVIDGFPSHSRHLELIDAPENWSIKYLFCPRVIRESRLVARSLSSNRKWTPGLPSERDLELPTLVKKIKADRKPNFKVIRN